MANKPERSRQVNYEGLTEKEALFALEYLKDLNKTQAYMRAYPDASHNTAMSNSSKIFSKPRVQKAIQDQMDARAQRTLVTADRVIHELAKLGFSDIRNIFTESGALKKPELMDENTAAAISSIEVVTRPSGEYDEDGNPIVENVHKIRMYDKRGTLELLGKHLVLFTDRTEHSGDITVNSGVLVVPKGDTIDDWEQQASQQQTDLKRSVSGSSSNPTKEN
jgi:phage terminase small subunit